MPKKLVSYSEYHSTFCQVGEELQVNCSRQQGKLLYPLYRGTPRANVLVEFLALKFRDYLGWLSGQ